MSRRTDAMYSDGPTTGRDENSGKVVVKRPEKANVDKEPAGGGAAGLGDLPVPARHASERRDMHHRHIAEHMAMHQRHEREHSHVGDKSGMHVRHVKEYKDMHTQHESEMKAMHSRHEKEAFAGGAADVKPEKAV